MLVDPTMSREHLYTALSRGRTSNHVYTAGDDTRGDLAHLREHTANDVDVLRRAIGRAHGVRLAHEGLGR